MGTEEVGFNGEADLTLPKVTRDDVRAALYDVYGKDVQVTFPHAALCKDLLAQVVWNDCGVEVRVEYRGKDIVELAKVIGLAYYRVKKGVLLELESLGVIRRREGSDEGAGETAAQASGTQGADGCAG